MPPSSSWLKSGSRLQVDERMMGVRTYFHLSRKLYHIKRLIDYRRVAVFIVRAMAHNGQMKQLQSFFQKDHIRQEIIEAYPGIYEQATRRWLYYQSTVKERIALITDHFEFLQSKFTEDAIRQLYLKDGGLVLWSEDYKGELLAAHLFFDEGHRKEGLAAVELYLGDRRIYRIIFWIRRDKNGQMALWIGALQGSPGEQQTIRDLTKHFFGYRTKNVVLHMFRNLASVLGLGKIYAVSNKGFYTNNHLRSNRMLKTSLDDFWIETDSLLCDDPRFFELQISEPRKSIESVESQKRNQYRKRFAKLDEISEQIAGVISACIVTPKEDYKRTSSLL